MDIILTHPVHNNGKQLFPHGRTAQIGTAVICTKKVAGRSKPQPAIGCRSEGNCLFSAAYATDDPKQLWLAMYAASKMFHVDVRAMEIAVLLVKEATIDEKLAREAKEYLSCDYTAEALRKEAFEQVIPLEDLKVISKAFGLGGQKKSVPKAQVFEHDTRSQIAFLAHLRDLRNKADTRLAA